MIPAIIRYTDDMPAWMGGYAKWFYIAIRPKYKDDKGIHAHELEHVKQWWITTILAALLIAGGLYFTQAAPVQYIYTGLSLAVFQLLYSIIPQFKLRMEVLAYREQLKHYENDRTALFARFISTKYGLKITADEAEQLLRTQPKTSEAHMR
jgi:hypothetical protein